MNDAVDERMDPPRTTTYRIAVIPGDGIGAEVIPPALRTLEVLAERGGFAFRFDHFDWSCRRYLETGAMMPADGLDRIAGHDAILLGAVGWPGVPDHVSLWGLLIPIRRQFRQYVNLRPIRVLPGLPGPLRDSAGVDLVVVRENVEGEYSEIGGRLNRGFADEFAVQEAVFTRAGVSRVVDHAFGLAAARRQHVTSATKSNGIVHTMPFWDEIVEERAARHPAVGWRREHIDALTAKLVLSPASFDVIVASNLFGDILSDLAAAIAGSIGIAPAGNINPERDFPSMFEPVHGSAPDIAGKGIANPLGALWSASLMLEHLGRPESAAALVDAIEVVLAEGAVRTPDLGGTATTDELGDAVLNALTATGRRAEK
ncbi:tartrate dehydrogenase [Plantactinospora sp. WMMC1484]|uniref:tartrate dehydrogenase n=1 Tax=Plantactinospora sp. WMMC1484 TaxID=3404122 RepID=UPI003BF476C1